MSQVYYFHGVFLDGVVKPDGKRVVDYAWCAWPASARAASVPMR